MADSREPSAKGVRVYVYAGSDDRTRIDNSSVFQWL